MFDEGYVGPITYPNDLIHSYETGGWSLARSEVSKISIFTLVSRCDYTLRKFLTDENDLGLC